jgi:aromatic-L-amino-acid decarboxylase
MDREKTVLGDMPADEFRKHGYEIVDWIANYFETIDQYPVLSQIEPGSLKNALPMSAPETGEDFSDVLADMDKLILPAVTHWNHPNFHGLFSTSTSSVGVFGEMFAAAVRYEGDAVADIARLDRTRGRNARLAAADARPAGQVSKGSFMTPPQSRPMHAIAAARERANLRIRDEGMSGRDELPLLRVYASEHVHSSIDKSCITLGLGTRSLRKIECNERFEMRADALADAIDEDIEAGYLPLCVIPTIGTTSTSSVDPVDAIADVVRKYGIWLHVDTAYAGPAAILPEKRDLFKGWGRADSIVVNPHKWLFTPFDLSVLYCRDLSVLKQAFLAYRRIS